LSLVKRTSTRSGPVSCRSSEYPAAAWVDTIDSAPFSTLTVTAPPAEVYVFVLGAAGGADVAVTGTVEPVAPLSAPLGPGAPVGWGGVESTALGAVEVVGVDEFAAGMRTFCGSEPPVEKTANPAPMITAIAHADPAATTNWWRRLARR
jgi:hypothetical protein